LAVTPSPYPGYVTTEAQEPRTSTDELAAPATTTRTLDVALLADAFALACRVHATQLRKGSQTPYLAHLLAVTSLVWSHEGTDVEAAGALLHDAVEDGGGLEMLNEIRDRCGGEVAAIVEACSDSFADTTAGEAKADWQTRKVAYIRHLAGPSVPDGARLVSACDKLHNLSATRADYGRVGEGVWDRFKTGWAGQVWYYRSLGAIYTACDDPRVRAVGEELADELRRLEAALTDGGHDLDQVRPMFLPAVHDGA
jgi:(p)ppGpp synthase/HD superfamily hydrolase